MKNLILILFASLFCFSCGQSQTEIKGEIFLAPDGKETQKPAAITVKIIKKEKFQNLKDSEILLTDADFFATTDADGRFSVKLPNGEYIVAAEVKAFNFQDKEYFHRWRVPFNATGGEKKIALNNTNAQ